MKSLGLATDFLAMTGESVIEQARGHTIQRTPNEPNFWFGNRVIFHELPTDSEALISQFRADLPASGHICIGWDIPGLAPDLVKRVFAGTDLIVDVDDVLTLAGPLTRPPMPEGIEARPLAGNDWAQSEDIGFADLMKQDYPQEGMRPYLTKRSATRRGQIAKGLGQWFGAFDGDLLVGDMGIFHDDKLIRFQSVQTRESHRRRGICSALLAYALDWAMARAPKAIPVIVALADSDAGRLYRRAGFAKTETMVAAFRPPK